MALESCLGKGSGASTWRLTWCIKTAVVDINHGTLTRLGDPFQFCLSSLSVGTGNLILCALASFSCRLPFAFI